MGSNYCSAPTPEIDGGITCYFKRQIPNEKLVFEVVGCQRLTIHNLDVHLPDDDGNRAGLVDQWQDQFAWVPIKVIELVRSSPSACKPLVAAQSLGIRCAGFNSCFCAGLGLCGWS